MRVLIGDGDEVVLGAVKTYLQRRGHIVHLATNGLDLLSPLTAFQPDVIIIDHDLRWCGFDAVLSALRHDPAMATVPVVMVADWETQYAAEENTNVVAWLQKPYQLCALLKTISTSTGLPESCEGTDTLSVAVQADHESEQLQVDQHSLSPQWPDMLAVHPAS